MPKTKNQILELGGNNKFIALSGIFCIAFTVIKCFQVVFSNWIFNGHLAWPWEFGRPHTPAFGFYTFLALIAPILTFSGNYFTKLWSKKITLRQCINGVVQLYVLSILIFIFYSTFMYFAFEFMISGDVSKAFDACFNDTLLDFFEFAFGILIPIFFLISMFGGSLKGKDNH